MSRPTESTGRIERALRRRTEERSPGPVLAEPEGPDVFASPWQVRIGPAPATAPDHGAPAAVAGRGFRATWLPRLVCAPNADHLLVEQFRHLAATLHQAQIASGITTVLVTSAEAAEGKSLTAVNLGLTLATSYGREVLVVDADLRRPSLHDIGQLPNATGLGDVLRASADQKLPVFQVADRLTFAPAGKADSDPMTALSSPRTRELLSEASQRFDWVIVDAPPVGPIADATLLAPLVDAVLLVVRAGRTHYAAARRAVDGIGRERVIGVVLNAADTIDTAAYRHYYDAYTPAPEGGRVP